MNNPTIRSEGLALRNHITSKFTSNLIGRFHAPGVSGSMEKHTKILKDTTEGNTRKKKFKPPPSVESSHIEEIEQDADKLKELEDRLQEIRKIKELKKQEEALKAQKRLELRSITRIQKYARKFLQRSRIHSAAVIIYFIKSCMARQAITAAAWASVVIQKFARKITFTKYLRQRIARKRQIIRHIATSTWESAVTDASYRVTLVRTAAARTVFQAITLGCSKVIQTMLRRRRRDAGASVGGDTDGSSPIGPFKRQTSFKKQASFKRQTSFKNNKEGNASSNGGDVDKPQPLISSTTDQSASPQTSPLESLQTANDNNSTPASFFRRSSQAGGGMGEGVQGSVEDMMSLAMKIATEAADKAGRRRIDEIQLLHRQREEAMEKERERRLIQIEQARVQREKDEQQMRVEAERKRTEKERIQREVLERIQTEHLDRARKLKKKREEKQRRLEEVEAQLAEEREREAAERKLMKGEEHRVVLLRWLQRVTDEKKRQTLKDTSKKQPLVQEKRPPVPRMTELFPEDEETKQRRLAQAAAKAAQQKREEEEAAAVLKRKAEAALLAARAALQMRLAERIARERERKREEEEEEAKRKEEQDRIAAEALRRVQIAVKRSKKKGKEKGRRKKSGVSVGQSSHKTIIDGSHSQIHSDAKDDESESGTEDEPDVDEIMGKDITNRNAQKDVFFDNFDPLSSDIRDNADWNPGSLLQGVRERGENDGEEEEEHEEEVDTFMASDEKLDKFSKLYGPVGKLGVEPWDEGGGGGGNGGGDDGNNDDEEVDAFLMSDEKLDKFSKVYGPEGTLGVEPWDFSKGADQWGWYEGGGGGGGDKKNKNSSNSNKQDLKVKGRTNNEDKLKKRKTSDPKNSEADSHSKTDKENKQRNSDLIVKQKKEDTLLAVIERAKKKLSEQSVDSYHTAAGGPHQIIQSHQHTAQTSHTNTTRSSIKPPQKLHPKAVDQVVVGQLRRRSIKELIGGAYQLPPLPALRGPVSSEAVKPTTKAVYKSRSGGSNRPAQLPPMEHPPLVKATSGDLIGLSSARVVPDDASLLQSSSLAQLTSNPMRELRASQGNKATSRISDQRSREIQASDFQSQNQDGVNLNQERMAELLDAECEQLFQKLKGKLPNISLEPSIHQKPIDANDIAMPSVSKSRVTLLPSSNTMQLTDPKLSSQGDRDHQTYDSHVFYEYHDSKSSPHVGASFDDYQVSGKSGGPSSVDECTYGSGYDDEEEAFHEAACREGLEQEDGQYDEGLDEEEGDGGEGNVDGEGEDGFDHGDEEVQFDYDEDDARSGFYDSSYEDDGEYGEDEEAALSRELNRLRAKIAAKYEYVDNNKI